MLEPVKDYPALLHTEEHHKTLIIADLHLGWEINLAHRGIHIPSQATKILQKLLKVISITNPETLIILGDVKHTIARAESGEWKDIPEFFETIKTRINDIQVVRGNHDGNLEPLLPRSVQLHPSSGITLDAVGLFHGHTWPAKKLLDSKVLVMGHAHPTLSFRDALGFQITTPVWVKVGIDKRKLETPRLSKHAKTSTLRGPSGKLSARPRAKQLIIIPCFNDFLGGRPINKRGGNKGYIGPLLRSEATNIEKGQVYLLDGTFLGTVEQLRGLS